MEGRFTNRVVVVTGAGSGIGAVTAARFADEGATVVVADIDAAAAADVADRLPRARAVTVDVSSRGQVRSVLKALDEELGGVNVLINNAMTCAETPFLDITEEEVVRDVAVDLTGAFYTCQAVLPGMIERGGGVILNLTSVNGLTYLGNEVYSAAKAGLISLTSSIAVRYGRQGIRCNAVAPGTIATPYWEHRVALDPEVLTKASQFYPLGRVGTPDDVAAALLFLASDEASWITGVTLRVDGGLLAGNLEMANDVVPLADQS